MELEVPGDWAGQIEEISLLVLPVGMGYSIVTASCLEPVSAI